MKRNEEYTMPAAARVLGYFIPVGVFLAGSYLYQQRKKRLGRKPPRAADLDHAAAKYKVAYAFDVAELAGVDTTVFPSVGQTVKIRVSSPIGTQWHAAVDPSGAMKVEVTDAPSESSLGTHEQVFYFTLREVADAQVTLTAIGPGNQVMDGVAFTVEGE